MLVFTGTDGTILGSLLCPWPIFTWNLLWTSFHVSAYGSTSPKKMHIKPIYRYVKLYVPGLLISVFCAFQSFATATRAAVKELGYILVLIVIEELLSAMLIMYSIILYWGLFRSFPSAFGDDVRSLNHSFIHSVNNYWALTMCQALALSQLGRSCPHGALLLVGETDYKEVSKWDSFPWWYVLWENTPEYAGGGRTCRCAALGREGDWLPGCCSNPDVAMNCSLHVIVSFLGIIFLESTQRSGERVWTLLYLLMCMAKIFSKSIDSNDGTPSPLGEPTSFSAATWAVPPFTSGWAAQPRGAKWIARGSSCICRWLRHGTFWYIP